MELGTTCKATKKEEEKKKIEKMLLKKIKARLSKIRRSRRSSLLNELRLVFN